MPVPIERKAKSSTPRATPCHCSPSAARLTSLTSVTRRPRRRSRSAPNGRPRGPRRRRERDPAALRRRPRDADDGTVQVEPSGPVASMSALPEPRDRVERARRRAAELDVLPGADVAAQVADRAAEEARAEVEPEHERRLGNRLEEDRAVVRAVRLARRLAHEPRADQRLERERHRRLRDSRAPRDLGSRDRRPGADRLEHRALVHVLEERRDRGGDLGLRSCAPSRSEP